MKKINKIVFGLFAMILMVSCFEGIDPISEVDPGSDAGAPVVTIIKPSDGLEIQVPELITSIQIQFKVTDDIEIVYVSVMLDGNQIASYDQFLDYRIFNGSFLYDNITTGDHTLTISATDLSGNITTATNNFTKSPPYTPLFAGEQFYMPFDGDFTDLISVTPANEVGSPGFSGTGFAGSNAYVAGTNNYLTFPLDGLTLGNNFSGAFWYKVNSTPDRSGILTIGASADDRNQGLRLFREGSPTEQRIKLNVGTGSGDSWNDGGVIDVTAGDWVHVAFTISATETKIYLNGMVVNMGTLPAPIDWTGTSELVIGAGGPTFSYWDHLSDSSWMDELRLFDIALSQSQVTQMVAQSSQTLYMSFNGSFTDSVHDMDATVVGNPGFAGEGYAGSNAYKGATDSYLTLPLSTLALGSEFTFAFWYKVNSTPDRSGILTAGANADDRNQGFRLFREGSPTEQRIKLNVGTGSGETWNDGDVINVTAGDWVHVAFTVSTTQTKIYLNGVAVANIGTLSGPIDWTGCSDLVIGSGGPTFSYWDHKSDTSAMDELRAFNKALSQAEIQSLML